MKISKAAKLWLEYHRSHSKESSIRAYELVLSKFCEEFGTENLEDITTERILSFLNRITEGRKRQTKRTRYSHLSAFFNFIKNNLNQEFRNSCDSPILRKLFRARPTFQWNIIEKETKVAIIGSVDSMYPLKSYHLPVDKENGALLLKALLAQVTSSLKQIPQIPEWQKTSGEAKNVDVQGLLDPDARGFHIIRQQDDDSKIG